MTYGYLRVSTREQNVEKFKSRILNYANTHDLGQVQFVDEHVSGTKNWKERELGRLLFSCTEGDKILVPELSRLARSVLQIHEILREAHERHVGIHVLKENLVVNGELDMTTKIVLNTLAMVAELERDMISERTKEALEQKRREGVKLGRPKGPGKSKLDEHRDEIEGLLGLGVPQSKLAEKYGVTRATMSRYIKVRDIL